MNKLTIVTNNHQREIVCGFELTEEEKLEFDWIDFTDENESNSFFRYKGEVYCLDDFMRIENHLNKDFSAWHGYHSDSFFSGIVVKYPDDTWGDWIIVGHYYS